MDLPECFGSEYFDEKGTACPHKECFLRYECKNVYTVAKGLRKEARKKEKIKAAALNPKKIIKNYSIKKKSGYQKPGRLLYKDEGTLRDTLLAEFRDFLEKYSFTVKATKCLHSFINDEGEFVLKVDTRRKNSLLCYIRKGLSSKVEGQGLFVRSLFESESPNFPEYLSSVVVVKSSSELFKLKDAFEKDREEVDDLK
tara:strand:- start:3313 stop:3906 length:594 start_codon:yes stop_codon:yes gene_type:complete